MIQDIDYEDSSDEYHAGEADLTTSDEDEEELTKSKKGFPLTKKSGKKSKNMDPTLTDDEEEDKDEYRNLRRENKAKLHDLIETA